MLQKYFSQQFLKAMDRLQYGALSLTTPDGQTRHFQGKNEGPAATLTLNDWSVIQNLIWHGDVGFVQDYQKELWETENLPNLLHFGLINENSFERFKIGSFLSRMANQIAYFLNKNSINGSKKNIQAHYDLGNDFYKLWLDKTMTYSSALYKTGDETMETAQTQKYTRILDELKTNSGSMLEIGCGWGGMAETAVNVGDFDFKGITLSNQQHEYAANRVNENGQIVLEDYRHQTGTYDHIVSIEMFEAVGEQYWNTYFSKIKSLLKKGGQAVIQTITIEDHRFEDYRRGSDMIRSYIFPGGMLPSVPRFDKELKNVGLKSSNLFSFGQDYAQTLLEWLKNFDNEKTAVKKLGFDDSFIKLWRFYLAACYAGFKSGRTDVIQINLEHV